MKRCREEQLAFADPTDELRLVWRPLERRRHGFAVVLLHLQQVELCASGGVDRASEQELVVGSTEHDAGDSGVASAMGHRFRQVVGVDPLADHARSIVFDAQHQL